jgi:acyl carrier protein
MTSALEPARALLADALARDLDEVPADATPDTLDAWDSLGHMRLVQALEQALDRSLTVDEILKTRSVAQIALLLDQIDG